MKRKSVIEIAGSVIFLFSLILYTVTLEPTTSFWDCSEFILSASKLEVNHPAGAPLFMLLGRLFSLLSFGNHEKIAWTINFMSGFFSALSVFFLFHVIAKLVRKISDHTISIIGTAVAGSLAFAVSDSFWFSAVEGEVYALSMFFMILSFWAALKWEEGFGETGNEKWILFLALITGLGIGVHLLNLLVLPTLVLIGGFTKYRFTLPRLFLFFGAGVFVLLAVLYGITPLVLATLARFDLVFVNSFGLPLHAGTLTGILIIAGLLTFLIFHFRKRKNKPAEIAVLSIALLLIGFSVYAVNLIRSSANPPINFGRPDNIYSLINYLNREQYPKRPLLYGQNYNSPVTGAEERSSKDFQEGEYRSTELAPIYKYPDETCTWFPRMYSADPGHVEAYHRWVDIRGRKVSVKQPDGTRETLPVPTFSEQLKFFVKYQFGYMFGRYFMWNFVGRQNDRQGMGNALYGNWLSGIRFIDEARLGPQNDLPGWLAGNRARNTYFFLPLLLGLLGAAFHYRQHRETFYAVLALFLMGGLALSVYINEVPVTPRERDYVFVVAFLAFSVWIGYGALAVSRRLSALLKNKTMSVPVFTLLLLAVPGRMLTQNFDDHKRSGRTAARDLALNILKSCPPNAILISSGDNDTYPLLYCQEVENIRTDVRVVIAPFLAANWFIDGLRKEKYTDSALKLMLPQQKFDRGELDYVPVIDRINRDTSWQEAFNLLKSDNEQAKVRMSSGEMLNFLPITDLNFEVKSEMRNGKIEVSLAGKKILYKHELAFWDILSSNAGERPLCFVSRLEAKKYGLDAYLECEGFAYRLVPEKSKDGNPLSIGKCDPQLLYKRLMNEFAFGNFADPKVYADWNSVLNVNVLQVRNVFNEVAAALLNSGDREKAGNLLRRAGEVLPLEKFPYDVFTLRQTELLADSGLIPQAKICFDYQEQEILKTLAYFRGLPQNRQAGIKNEMGNHLYYLNGLSAIAAKMGDREKAAEIRKKLDLYAARN